MVFFHVALGNRDTGQGDAGEEIFGVIKLGDMEVRLQHATQHSAA